MDLLEKIFGERIYAGKNKKIFNGLKNLGAGINEAAVIFSHLVSNCGSVRAREYAQKLHQIEHQCDFVVREIFEISKESFILRMEHEDIYALARGGDSIVDCLWGAGNRIGLIYELSDPDEELYEIASLILVMCRDEVKKIFDSLDTLKTLKDPVAIVRRLHDYENRTDQLREIVSKRRFFAAKDDPSLTRLWIAWKEVYEHLESAGDRCADVADILSDCCVKYT